MGNPIGGGFSSNEPPRSSRRGRLFDLIDDGEDEPHSDVDVVSGMLTNLDANMFQSSQDVDIEAISLMGIGGTPLGGPGLGAPGTGRTTGRFG